MADFQLPPARTHAVDTSAKITPAGRRAPSPGDARGLLRLQATAGNHAVQRLITGKANAAAVVSRRQFRRAGLSRACSSAGRAVVQHVPRR